MHKRAALINNLENMARNFPRHFQGIDINAVEIYIDVHDKKERRNIVEILRIQRTRLPLIVIQILKNKYDEDHYGTEPYGCLAIKFKNGRLNSRIYCKEFGTSGEKKKVVLIKGVINKSSNAIKKELKTELKSIEKYEYEFFILPKDAIKHREK